LYQPVSTVLSPKTKRRSNGCAALGLAAVNSVVAATAIAAMGIRMAVLTDKLMNP
jgi:hypothetical protein